MMGTRLLFRVWLVWMDRTEKRLLCYRACKTRDNEAPKIGRQIEEKKKRWLSFIVHEMSCKRMI